MLTRKTSLANVKTIRFFKTTNIIPIYGLFQDTAVISYESIVSEQ